MNDATIRLLQLSREGYGCSQILIRMFLETRGEDNPALVRSMTGLTYGCSEGRATGGTQLEVLLEFIDPGSPAAIVFIGWRNVHGTSEPGLFLTMLRFAGKKALNHSGFSLDLHLIRASALAHDMARGQPDHAHQGAGLLRDLDMPLMAAIVETHMEMFWDEQQPVREGEVVFLADKLVQEDRFVGLDARFSRRLNEFPLNSQSRNCVRRRLGTARKIAERIESEIGRSLKILLDCSPVACEI